MQERSQSCAWIAASPKSHFLERCSKLGICGMALRSFSLCLVSVSLIPASEEPLGRGEGERTQIVYQKLEASITEANNPGHLSANEVQATYKAMHPGQKQHPGFRNIGPQT